MFRVQHFYDQLSRLICCKCQ